MNQQKRETPKERLERCLRQLKERQKIIADQAPAREERKSKKQREILFNERLAALLEQEKRLRFVFEVNNWDNALSENDLIFLNELNLIPTKIKKLYSDYHAGRPLD